MDVTKRIIEIDKNFLSKTTDGKGVRYYDGFSPQFSTHGLLKNGNGLFCRLPDGIVLWKLHYAGRLRVAAGQRLSVASLQVA